MVHVPGQELPAALIRGVVGVGVLSVSDGDGVPVIVGAARGVDPEKLLHVHDVLELVVEDGRVAVHGLDQRDEGGEIVFQLPGAQVEVPAVAGLVRPAVGPGGPLQEVRLVAAAVREGLLAHDLHEDAVRVLGEPKLEVFRVRRLDALHHVGAGLGSYPGPGGAVVGAGRGGGRVTPDAVPRGLFVLAVAVAAEVDLGAVAKRLVLREGDPVHARIAGAVPGAASPACSDIVVDLLLVEDEGGIQQLVGVQLPSAEPAPVGVIVDEAIGERIRRERTGMLVDQVPARCVAGLAAAVSGGIHRLDIEGDLCVVGEAGDIASEEAISRFAIRVGSIVEQLGLTRGVVARGVIERSDGVYSIRIAYLRENGDLLSCGGDRGLVDNLAQNRSEVVGGDAVHLAGAAEVVGHLQPVRMLALGILPVAAEVEQVRSAQPAGLQGDLVRTGGHPGRGLGLDTVDPGVAVSGGDNLETGIARGAVFRRTARLDVIALDDPAAGVALEAAVADVLGVAAPHLDVVKEHLAGPHHADLEFGF